MSMKSTVDVRAVSLIALIISYFVVVGAAHPVRSFDRRQLEDPASGTAADRIHRVPFVFGEYLDIVSAEYRDMIDPELLGRGAAWKRLALVRCAVVVAVGLLPLVALARSEVRSDESSTG